MIQETRAGLAETLTEALEFEVLNYLPGRLAEPSGFIIPGAPYLTPDIAFGHFVVRYEAHLVFQGVNNESATDDIDPVVENAIVAAVQAGWSVESVSEPFQVTLSGTTYLLVQLQVTRAIQL